MDGRRMTEQNIAKIKDALSRFRAKRDKADADSNGEEVDLFVAVEIGVITGSIKSFEWVLSLVESDK